MVEFTTMTSNPMTGADIKELIHEGASNWYIDTIYGRFESNTDYANVLDDEWYYFEAFVEEGFFNVWRCE